MIPRHIMEWCHWRNSWMPSKDKCVRSSIASFQLHNCAPQYAKLSMEPGQLPNKSFNEARQMSNLFEELGQGQGGGLSWMFMSWSTIKLANIDAVLDFSLMQCNGHFQFVDLCEAPAGFSKYLMRRSQANGVQSCLGHGMPLHSSNEHGHTIWW